MRILFILLLVGFCIVSAKYIPQETSDTDPVLYRVRRSDSDSNAASEERDDNSNNHNDNNDDNDDDNDEDSAEKKEREKLNKLREKEEKEERKRQEKIEKERQKEIEEKRKEEEKIAKQQRKEHERLEKERRKLQERIEKERRKQEEEERKEAEKIEKERRKQEERERKEAEKIEKEERKREEKLKKELEKLQKEQRESAEDRYLETEEEGSVELEDIWKIHVYDKYGINVTSTKWERQAALQKYLQEEMGIDANSTKSERRQAIMKLIQTKLQNDSATVDSLRNLMLSHVNAAQIQKMRSKLETDLQELNNKSKLLQNVTLPGASVAQQNVEEKRTFLQTIAQFLPNIIPTWFTDSETSDNSAQTNVSNDNGLNNVVGGANNVERSQPNVNRPSINNNGAVDQSNVNVSFGGVATPGNAPTNLNSQTDSQLSTGNPSQPSNIGSLNNSIDVGQTNQNGVSTTFITSGNSGVAAASSSSAQSSDNISQINAQTIITDDSLLNNNVIAGESNINVPNTVSASSSSGLASGASTSGFSTSPSEPNITSDNGSLVNNNNENQGNLNVLPKTAAASSTNPEPSLATYNILQQSSSNPSEPGNLGSVNNNIIDGQSYQSGVLTDATTLDNSGLSSVVSSPRIGQSSEASSQKPSAPINVSLNYNTVVGQIHVNLLPNTAINSEPENVKPSQPSISTDNGSLKNKIGEGQIVQSGMASESESIPSSPSQPNVPSQINNTASPSEGTVLPKSDAALVNSVSASVSQTVSQPVNDASTNAVSSDNAVSSATVAPSSGEPSVNILQTNVASDNSPLNNKDTTSSSSDFITTASASGSDSTSTNTSQTNVPSQSSTLNNDIAVGPSEVNAVPNTDVPSVNTASASISQPDQNGVSTTAVASDNSVSSATVSSSSGEPSVNVLQTNVASDSSSSNNSDAASSSLGLTTTASASGSDSTSTNPSQTNVPSHSIALNNNVAVGPPEINAVPNTDVPSVNTESTSVSQTDETGASANAVALDNSVSSAPVSANSGQSSVDTQQVNAPSDNSALHIRDAGSSNSDLTSAAPASGSKLTSTVTSQRNIVTNVAGSLSESTTLPNADASPVDSKPTSVSPTNQNETSATTSTLNNSVSSDTVSSSSGQTSLSNNISNAHAISDNSAVNGNIDVSIPDTNILSTTDGSSSNTKTSSVTDNSSLNNSTNVDYISVLPKDVPASSNSDPINEALNSGPGELSINSTETNAVSNNGLVKNDIVSIQTNAEVLPDTVPSVTTESSSIDASSISLQFQTSMGTSEGQKDVNLVPETVIPSATTESLIIVASSVSSQPQTSVDNSDLINNIDVRQSNIDVLPKKESVSSNSDSTTTSIIEPDQPSITTSQPSARGDNSLLENVALKNNATVPVPVTDGSYVNPESTSNVPNVSGANTSVNSNSAQSDVIVFPKEAAIMPSSELPNEIPINISEPLLTNSPLPRTTSENSSLNSDIVGTTVSSIIVKDVSPSGIEKNSTNSESPQEITVSNLNNSLNDTSSSSVTIDNGNNVTGDAIVTGTSEAVSTGNASFTSTPDVVADITSTNAQLINENLINENTVSQITTDAAATNSVTESVKVGDLSTVSVNSPVIPIKEQAEPGAIDGQENVNTPTNSALVTTEATSASEGLILPAGVIVPDEPGASFVGLQTQ